MVRGRLGPTGPEKSPQEGLSEALRLSQLSHMTTAQLRCRVPRFAALLGLGCLGASVLARPAQAGPQERNPYGIFDQLARVLVLVENEYVEPVDRTRLADGAIKGTVAELDPHSSYLPREDYSLFQSDTEGRFAGIGVEVDFRGEVVVVIAPIEGSPAARAGVRAGDHILAIDKVPVRGKSAEDLIRTMRGRPGSRIVLTVRRPGRDKLLYFRLLREVIHVPSVVHQRLRQGIGYLRIKQFQTGTHQELLQAVANLRKQGKIQGILLDLRNNPGGLVDEASAVADEFLDSGVIYTARHRRQVVEEVRALPRGALTRGPVAVLVNEYSASAAELVAGALQDQGRAVLVGAKTFGKGSVQSIFNLPGNTALRLTTMRYYTPHGKGIQARGVEPTVRVDTSRGGAEGGVVRESDLENHLPAEGPGKTPASPRAVEPENGTSPAEPNLSNVPEDPTTGSDAALRIAFEIVTGVLLGTR